MMKTTDGGGVGTLIFVTSARSSFHKQGGEVCLVSKRIIGGYRFVAKSATNRLAYAWSKMSIMAMGNPSQVLRASLGAALEVGLSFLAMAASLNLAMARLDCFASSAR